MDYKIIVQYFLISKEKKNHMIIICTHVRLTKRMKKCIKCADSPQNHHRSNNIKRESERVGNEMMERGWGKAKRSVKKVSECVCVCVCVCVRAREHACICVRMCVRVRVSYMCAFVCLLYAAPRCISEMSREKKEELKQRKQNKITNPFWKHAPTVNDIDSLTFIVYTTPNTLKQKFVTYSSLYITHMQPLHYSNDTWQTWSFYRITMSVLPHAKLIGLKKMSCIVIGTTNVQSVWNLIMLSLQNHALRKQIHKMNPY
jgi:hypothetical protein